jgi:hypothetical protein
MDGMRVRRVMRGVRRREPGARIFFFFSRDENGRIMAVAVAVEVKTEVKMKMGM